MRGIDRFYNKADKYELYRPNYTNESIDLIIEKCKIDLNNNLFVADIGSGTGKFTKLLLDKGFNVFAIEPNSDMRKIAQKKFKNYNNFISLDNTAEDTGLKENSVDLITVAQAFHYFDLDKVKKEFKRILKPNGKVVLIWNFRLRSSNFISQYEDIIYSFHSNTNEPTHAQDKMVDEVFSDFFSDYTIFNISNEQKFNFDSLWGRTLSNNHMPSENEEDYDILYNKIKELFDIYQKDNEIIFPYRTQIVIGNF